jgi:hypothetical protein
MRFISYLLFGVLVTLLLAIVARCVYLIFVVPYKRS